MSFPLLNRKRLRDYWSGKFLLSTPGISTLMTEPRFFDILDTLSFQKVKQNIYQQAQAADKWRRIRSFMNEVLNVSKLLKQPVKELSIAEIEIILNCPPKK